MADPGENGTPYIYGKSKEEAVTKYLVAMTSEEIGAEKMNKDSQPSDTLISSEGVRQVWKPEQQVPLCKVKLYEKEHFGERGKKGTPGKKKKAPNKVKVGSLKKRSLSVVVEKLLEVIKLGEKKLELSAKKSQSSNSPLKSAAERKSEPLIIRYVHCIELFATMNSL